MSRFLFRPISPWIVGQPFGEKGVCINDVKKLVPSDAGVCPSGFRSIYPTGGHNGIDIPCSRWRPIYAATEGTVIEVQTEEARGLGISIVTSVQHSCLETGKPEFFKHRYWHLAAIDVHLGEKIRVGQFIGYADSTGYSTGDHLHFELKPVKKNNAGEWINFLQNSTVGAVDPGRYLFNRSAEEAGPILYRMLEQAAKILDMLADVMRYGKAT